MFFHGKVPGTFISLIYYFHQTTEYFWENYSKAPLRGKGEGNLLDE
jgi:hypothetical protein